MQEAAWKWIEDDICSHQPLTMLQYSVVLQFVSRRPNHDPILSLLGAIYVTSVGESVRSSDPADFARPDNALYADD